MWCPIGSSKGATMGRKIPPDLVAAYADAFAEEPRLKDVPEMNLFVFVQWSPKPQNRPPNRRIVVLAFFSGDVFKTAPRLVSPSFWTPPGTCLDPRRRSPSETWRRIPNRLAQSCVCPEEWVGLVPSFCSTRCCGSTRYTSFSLLDFALKWSA